MIQLFTNELCTKNGIVFCISTTNALFFSLINLQTMVSLNLLPCFISGISSGKCALAGFVLKTGCFQRFAEENVDMF